MVPYDQFFSSDTFETEKLCNQGNEGQIIDIIWNDM